VGPKQCHELTQAAAMVTAAQQMVEQCQREYDDRREVADRWETALQDAIRRRDEALTILQHKATTPE